jgi:hypothetical protein
MALGHGASIVRSNLALHLDAANKKSYSGSGTTWSDLSGNGRNATLVNLPTYNSTHFSFDGTNDVSTLSNNFIPADSSLTVSVWVKARSDGMLVDTLNDSLSWDGFTIRIQSNTYRWWLFKQNSSPNIQAALASTLSYNGNWQNVTGTYNGTTASLYIDGILDVSVSYSGGYDLGTANIGIGARASTANPCNCDISNVSIYNRALTAAEVSQNFNAFRGRYGV